MKHCCFNSMNGSSCKCADVSLDDPWRCPRCGRSDLLLRHASMHGDSCLSRTDAEEDAHTENMELELRIDRALELLGEVSLRNPGRWEQVELQTIRNALTGEDA